MLQTEIVISASYSINHAEVCRSCGSKIILDLFGEYDINLDISKYLTVVKTEIYVGMFSSKLGDSNRIERISEKLRNRGQPKNINGVSVIVLSGLRKGEVKVKDLGKLQAATGHEYTLLRGKEGRVLIRGTPNQVGIPDEYHRGYIWCGHSHPDDTSPSQSDRQALQAFGHEYSVIVSACWKKNSQYRKYRSPEDYRKYETRRFEQFEDWSGWLP